MFDARCKHGYDPKVCVHCEREEALRKVDDLKVEVDVWKGRAEYHLNRYHKVAGEVEQLRDDRRVLEADNDRLMVESKVAREEEDKWKLRAQNAEFKLMTTTDMINTVLGWKWFSDESTSEVDVWKARANKALATKLEAWKIIDIMKAEAETLRAENQRLVDACTKWEKDFTECEKHLVETGRHATAWQDTAGKSNRDRVRMEAEVREWQETAMRVSRDNASLQDKVTRLIGEVQTWKAAADEQCRGKMAYETLANDLRKRVATDGHLISDLRKRVATEHASARKHYEAEIAELRRTLLKIKLACDDAGNGIVAWIGMRDAILHLVHTVFEREER